MDEFWMGREGLNIVLDVENKTYFKLKYIAHKNQ